MQEKQIKKKRIPQIAKDFFKKKIDQLDSG
jgi:hypothetical protein